MAKKKKSRKIFVLDTSVILHDHDSINNFDDNDVAIPITVLEELDTFKRGGDTKNYSAREFTRMLDKLSTGQNLDNWIPLDGKGKFKVVLYTKNLKKDAEKVFMANKADHRILNAVLYLQDTENTQDVILVSKDINLRMKAKGLGIEAQDYKSDKVVLDSLYTGRHEVEHVDSGALRDLFTHGVVDADKIDTTKIPNHFYILNDGNSSSLASYNPHEDTFERVEKKHCYGIKPRNSEQAFAFHALLNPEVKIVTLQGVAGTGKTLLALASAIEQRNMFNQILIARPIVGLSNQDIGFLPGDIDSKVTPYMEPLWDNLKVIKNQYKETEKKYKVIDKLQEDKKIVISALAYIRGRSFSDTFFIVDESQNLSPHEIKTIITRAGDNTKIIFTGDIHQIDTPFLDEQSNGLSYLIDRFKGQKLFAHITLEKGERSELANLANELL